MKWLLLSDYTHYLHAKESSFFKYISGTPTVVWIVFEGKRARLVCFTSHMESMKAFYNGEKNERSKIRVRWKKEGGRQAGKNYWIFCFWPQHYHVFQNWVGKTNAEKENHFWMPDPYPDWFLFIISEKVRGRVMMKVEYKTKRNYMRPWQEHARLNDAQEQSEQPPGNHTRAPLHFRRWQCSHLFQVETFPQQ